MTLTAPPPLQIAKLPTEPAEAAELARHLRGRPIPGVVVAADDYLDWALRTEIDAEWVDGKVVLMAPAADEHSSLNLFLMRLIAAFLDERDLGEIRFDMAVWLPDSPSYRVPDLLFVRTQNLDIIQPTRIVGVPDMVLEIISRDSTDRDWHDKFREYESAGVLEYWIVDPLAQHVTLFQLSDGKYQKIAADENGRFPSTALLGLWVEERWLFGEPRTKVAEALAAIRAVRILV